MFTRFAIYFCPEPETQLAQFGTHWLGWNLDSGKPANHPEVSGFDIAAVTERPRKYGFHGTMKAPFRLAHGQSLDALKNAADDIAVNIKAFNIPDLHVSRTGKFLAVTEAMPCQPLRDLAAHVVEAFEPFRAPLTDSDLERRRKSNLSAAQDALLVKWGYPYVFDEFQFHLTLSGPLDPVTQDLVAQEAERLLRPILDTPQPCRSFSICAEREAGSFIRLSRHLLRT
ncbi:MAG: DUF1045 domain-containing protein [Pseudomonadota bacterium]